MSTIITIYLIVGLCVAFVSILLKYTFHALMAAVYIVFLPVMPFIVAYNNRKIKPIQSKLIVILWGVLYLLIMLLCILP